MSLDNIFSSIDAEIARLLRARALLSGATTTAPGDRLSTKPKRKLSAAARKKMSEAQKKRWTAKKKGAK